MSYSTYVATAALNFAVLKKIYSGVKGQCVENIGFDERNMRAFVPCLAMFPGCLQGVL